MSNTNFESCAVDFSSHLKPAFAISLFNDADGDVFMTTISPVTASSSCSSLAWGTLLKQFHLSDKLWHAAECPLLL